MYWRTKECAVLMRGLQGLLIGRAVLETQGRIRMFEKYKELAKDIYNELGIGYDECIYHKAFEVALRINKIDYESKCIIPVLYKGYNVGQQEIDLIIRVPEDNVILELKAIETNLMDDQKAQLHRYLKLLKSNNGLLINFIQCGKSKKIDYSKLYISDNIEPEYYEVGGLDGDS